MHDQCHSDFTDALISDSQLGLSNQTCESAKFLLHTTEEHHLTHGVVNSLCDSVQWLVDSLFSSKKTTNTNPYNS